MRITSYMVVLCFGYIIIFSGFREFILPYSSGLLHWHWGNHMIAPMPIEVTMKELNELIPSQYEEYISHLLIILFFGLQSEKGKLSSTWAR